MVPMVLNTIILIFGVGFLFQPLNGSKTALVDAIRNGDESAERLAMMFDPSAVINRRLKIKRGIGRNKYWNKTNISYKITVLDLSLLYRRENVATILIDREADIFTQDQFGNTPLHIAAGQGLNTAVIQLLKKIKMTKPQALDLQNKAGKTPLHFALSGYRDGVINTLLDGRANPIIVDNSGNTALHLAIEHHQSDQIIIDIIEATKAQSIHVLGHSEPFLFLSGQLIYNSLDRYSIGDPTLELLKLRNNNGRTTLSHALYYCRKEISRILLKLGADPTITDIDGNTPLHLAIEHYLSDEIIIDIIKATRAKAFNNLSHNEMTNPSGCSSGTMGHDCLDPSAIGEATSEILNLRNHQGQTALWIAVKFNRGNIAKILFLNGADPTISDQYGDSPLHIHLPSDMTDETIILMIENIDVNHVNRDGKIILQYAFNKKREVLIKHLLKRGADPVIRDSLGNTALHLAIESRLSEQIITDIIKAARAKTGDNLSYIEMRNPSGCSSGTMDHDCLDPIAIGEATSEILNLRNHQGRTALWMAVNFDRGNIANILFLNGADPSISDQYGDSPWHTGLPTDMTDETIILMIENIDVNHGNRDGKSLLQYAIEEKREVLIKYLLKRGADPIIPDRLGDSALNQAMFRGLSKQIIIDIIEAARPKPIHLVLQNPMTTRFYACLVKQLFENLNRDVVTKIITLSSDDSINSKRHNGQTAFSLAVDLKRFDIAQALLKNGADPTIPDDRRNTPLHTLLLTLTDNSILSLIHNIDINHLYNDGSSLFHWAIKYHRDVVVMKLLKRGADPIIADSNGNTALHLAIEHNLSGETIISILEAATPRTGDILGPDGMKDPSMCSSGELVHNRDPDVNRQATSEIINFRNQKWQTALFLAVTHARFDLVQILVQRGADCNIADIDGKTPLHTNMPIELTDEIIISMIKTIDVNHVGNGGATLLQRAIECNRKVVVKYLLKRGATFRITQ